MILPGIDTLVANLEWRRRFDALAAELAEADEAHARLVATADWTKHAEVTFAEQALLAHIRKARR